MVGLCIFWLDSDIFTPSAKVNGYKAHHRKSIYNQFCPLLADECAVSGHTRNPRQWVFELAIHIPSLKKTRHRSVQCIRYI